MDRVSPVEGSAVSPDDGRLPIGAPTVPPVVQQQSITSIRELEADINDSLIKVRALDHIPGNYAALRKCAS